ncbi:uncharacterized protein [Neodiprion pinetum]|uniref:uncharacterized protein isoform X1 n=1 Tax=Neodiprion pinetum TaxID=441929 RepID=UPI001EDF5A09|nr:uncharacterized protein LOC124216146 isoform X1 [Neodiprion pinetum]
MVKLTFYLYLYVVGLCLVDLSNGKPLARVQRSKHPKVTSIKTPRAIITRDELVALAQYAMRMMASRINITLQPTTISSDSPERPDHPRVTSGIDRPTITTAPPPSVPGIRENVKQTYQEFNEYVNRKSQDPRQRAEGAKNFAVLSQNPLKFSIGHRVQLPTENRPLKSELFTASSESDVDTFLKEYNLEFLPQLAYIPRTETSTGVISSVEHQIIPNNQLLPLSKYVVLADGNKNLGSSSIRVKNLTIENIAPSERGSAVMSVPFEAIITFTRQKPAPSPKLDVDVIPTRDPPDDFPPYFGKILPVERKTSNSRSGSLISRQENNLNPAEDTTNEVNADKMDGDFKPMLKRQAQRKGVLLEMLGVPMKNSEENRNGDEKMTTPSPPDINTSGIMNVVESSSAQLKKGNTVSPETGPMSQRQEIEEEEEDEGSLGSLADLLPLVTPILEDLSDPNTETDLVELLEAGIPLIEGLSQGDEDGEGAIDLVGIVSPVIASLSGPYQNGNGTIFQAILPLILPLISPFIGPIVGPIIQGSSNPDQQSGSSITPLIQAIAGPLSLPTQPGGISIASSLIAGIIASLSKDLKAGAQGGSDISAAISTLVSGVIAGGSAGLSAGHMKQPRPTRTHHGYGTYGQGPVPASSVDTLDLVGSSIKDTLGLSLQLVKSVISSVTEILGASSAEHHRPVYGPPKADHRVT